MADNPKPQGMPEEPQGYTAESLQNDGAAAVKAQTESNLLDELNRNIAAVGLEIDRLTNEMEQVTLNPGLIPVPADYQANPLAAIGAGLRAIGGDSSSLDGMLAEKRNVAIRQQQVAAQNVVIQNEHQRRQYQNIFEQLQQKRAKKEEFELTAAEIVDDLNADAREKRAAAFEAQVQGLLLGDGDVDALINDFPQEFKDSHYTRSYLTAMSNRGNRLMGREERLAQPDPPRREPVFRSPEGASQDAEQADLILSRGYHLVPKFNSSGVEIGKERVALTPAEIRSHMTKLRASIDRMTDSQAEIWQERLDHFQQEYDIAPGPQPAPDDLSMIDFANDLQKFVYG